MERKRILKNAKKQKDMHVILNRIHQEIARNSIRLKTCWIASNVTGMPSWLFLFGRIFPLISHFASKGAKCENNNVHQFVFSLFLLKHRLIQLSHYQHDNSTYLMSLLLRQHSCFSNNQNINRQDLEILVKFDL
jgi:hypothetical protein